MNLNVLIDGRPAQGRPRGMGIYTLRLVAALSALPDAPQITVALDKTAGGDPWAGQEGIGRVWGAGKNPVSWEQRVLPRLAAGAKVDLLHCTANGSPWRPTVPQVVTIHDAIFLRNLWEISDFIYPRQIAAHLYYRYGVGPGARKARQVLTVSEHSRRELIRRLHLQPDHVRAIPSAEPYAVKPLPEVQVEAVLSEWRIEKPYVLGLGAIDRRKNTANLVRAFARLPRAAAAMLVLAGFEKADQSRIPRLIKELGMDQRVKILSYLPVDQLTALFQGAAAFAYPTLAEGFGLPLLQAYSLGVPVVTTKLDVLTEITGSTAARFADPADPRSLSRELMAILTDPAEAHRLAYAGYLQAKTFTWEATARKTLDAYRSALEARA